jgi:hypothetical protein
MKLGMFIEHADVSGGTPNMSYILTLRLDGKRRGEVPHGGTSM